MSTAPPLFLVVVPTRNRTDLACTAVESVLRQAGTNVRVAVSDNSTRPEEAEALRTRCASRDPDRLRYLRPPEPLPMARHWQWALDQALREEPAATHVLYLTDRMIFRTDGLPAVLDVASRHPDRVLSFNLDRVDDFERPVRLEQNRWSGALLEVRSSHLLAMTARLELHRGLPAMLNTTVPRTVLDRIRDRFGGVFDSISPDFCFAYRCLATVDAILHLDRAPLIHYAMDRSNGAGMARGIPSADGEDFLRNLGTTAMNFAAPVPAFINPTNAVLHEYCLLKRSVSDPPFPDVDLPRYLRSMRWEIEAIRNPGLKDEMLRLLETEAASARAAGLSVDLDLKPPPPPSVGARLARVAGNPRLIVSRALRTVRAIRRGTARLLRRTLSVAPSADDDTPLAFASLDDALAHAERHPRGRVGDLSHLAPLDGRVLER